MSAHPAERDDADPTPDDTVGDSGLFDVVSSTVPFTGKIISVHVDRVVMPGGVVAAREVVHHHRAVAVVALDDQDRVVLVGQYRHPLRRRLWELPAGLMDIEGEDPVTTAARELAEETGLAARDWRHLIDVASSPGIIDETIRIYLARGLSDVERGETAHEEADLTVDRVPLESAVQAVFRGDIVNGPAVAGLLAAGVALSQDRELPTGPDDWSTGQARIRGDDEPLGRPPVL